MNIIRKNPTFKYPLVGADMIPFCLSQSSIFRSNSLNDLIIASIKIADLPPSDI